MPFTSHVALGSAALKRLNPRQTRICGPDHLIYTTKKGRRIAASLDRPRQIGRSGERWFALTASYEKLVTDLRGEHVFLLLEPCQLGFQVTHAPLEAAHFGYYAGVRPADVAK